MCNKAKALKALGRADEAEALIQRALALNPDLEKHCR